MRPHDAGNENNTVGSELWREGPDEIDVVFLDGGARVVATDLERRCGRRSGVLEHASRLKRPFSTCASFCPPLHFEKQPRTTMRSPATILATVLLSLALPSPATAQQTFRNNLTSLSGTWSTGSGGVVTGPVGHPAHIPPFRSGWHVEHVEQQRFRGGTGYFWIESIRRARRTSGCTQSRSRRAGDPFQRRKTESLGGAIFSRSSWAESFVVWTSTIAR